MWEALFWYGLAEFAFSLSPGPAVLLVTSHAIWRGFHSSLATIFGILAVNILYFVLSALGVGVALAAAPTAFHFIKIAGALYLVWCAIEILHDLMKNPTSHQVAQPRLEKTLTTSFLRGAVIQISNVKNLVIFIAILPQFITPNDNVEWQFLWLGVVSIAIELPILLGYAILATKLSEHVHKSGYTKPLEGITAGIFIIIAGSMVVL